MEDPLKSQYIGSLAEGFPYLIAMDGSNDAKAKNQKADNLGKRDINLTVDRLEEVHITSEIKC
jgi:hypothetical protein